MSIYDKYILGEELKHSAKGTTWKDHKYVAKKTSKSGNEYYVYKQKNRKTLKDIMNEPVPFLVRPTEKINKMLDNMRRKKKKYSVLDDSTNNKIRGYKA